jgi:hypothetical protein
VLDQKAASFCWRVARHARKRFTKHEILTTALIGGGVDAVVSSLVSGCRHLNWEPHFMFSNFGELDPLLQFLTIATLVAFLSIVGFKIRRYLQKRRTRSRSKIWTIY